VTQHAAGSSNHKRFHLKTVSAEPPVTESSATESPLPVPLLIVEDDVLMQQRLRGILMSLGYKPEDLFIAGSVAAARTLYAEQPYAMALVDIHLPDGTGIELIRDWHEKNPELPMLVISVWGTSTTIVSALQAGATGYLLKERDDMEIALWIRSALRGGAPIDPFIARHILAIAAQDAPANASAVVAAPVNGERLSPREIEILGLVNQGMTNKEIAKSLTLSNLTIEC
jgi:DNA-binding NarL/FixJ family response regulator